MILCQLLSPLNNVSIYISKFKHLIIKQFNHPTIYPFNLLLITILPILFNPKSNYFMSFNFDLNCFTL